MQSTYEIINPEEVGADGSKIVLTARSGRSALAHRFLKLGYNYNRNDIDVLYIEFFKVADKKKEVEDADLEVMAKSFEAIIVRRAARRRPAGRATLGGEVRMRSSILRRPESSCTLTWSLRDATARARRSRRRRAARRRGGRPGTGRARRACRPRARAPGPTSGPSTHADRSPRCSDRAAPLIAPPIRKLMRTSVRSSVALARAPATRSAWRSAAGRARGRASRRAARCRGPRRARRRVSWPTSTLRGDLHRTVAVGVCVDHDVRARLGDGELDVREQSADRGRGPRRGRRTHGARPRRSRRGRGG